MSSSRNENRVVPQILFCQNRFDGQVVINPGPQLIELLKLLHEQNHSFNIRDIYIHMYSIYCLWQSSR